MLPVVNGRYALLKPVGDGRLSSVYCAEDLRRYRTKVAVKILNSGHPDEFRQELFRREALALERLTHPNIIQIIDQGMWEAESCFYIVLEWLDHSLADRLLQPTAESIDSAWKFSLLYALADALVYAHSEGIIHRDIKPSNILFNEIGEPKLSDFGISRLQYELSSGLTVSGFWSAGYAAPEQRSGLSGDERSDLYSLGAVALHLLSGRQPTADGPDLSLIPRLETVPEAKELLRRLLASDPSDRHSSALEARTALQRLDSQLRRVPELLVVVSAQVIRKLYDLNLIHAPRIELMTDWVIQALGGSELRPVPARLEPNGDVRLLGGNVRMVCRPANDRSALVLHDVQIPYGPDLEAWRRSADSLRCLWQPIGSSELASVSWEEAASSRRTLFALLDQLSTHNGVQEAQVGRRRERRGLIDAWERILAIRQQRIEERRHPLAYTDLVATQDYFAFELRDPAPDTLPWTEGSPIAIVGGDHGNRLISVGSLVSVSGTQVTVTRKIQHPSDERAADPHLPDSGFICLFVSEELSTLKREQTALRQLAAGDARNPRLVEVLTDLRRSERDHADDELGFIQAELDEDKREAVRNALATRDLFLIQGPPGTGKTTVIAEIIMQLLRADPNLRILVTSQSNVPVNHVLSKVSSLHSKDPLEIVRLGRAEKIGQGAEIWQVDQRLAAWRAEIVVHCERKRAELIVQTRQRTLDRRRDRMAMSEDSLQLCQEWLQEAADLLRSLRDEEERLGLLRRDRAATAHPVAGQHGVDLQESELWTLEDAVSARSEDLEAHIGAVYDLLPESRRGVSLLDAQAEIDRLKDIVNRLSVNEDHDAARARRQLIDEWMAVFGLTRDFEAPLLKRANIIAATCLFSGSRVLREDTYDWVIVDEAGRATATELFVPLVKARRAILVGDERQLPPMLDEEITTERLRNAGVADEAIQHSLFENLIRDARHYAPETVRMLTVQHRMHPAIGQLISDVFYEGKLSHGVAKTNRDHGVVWIDRPVMWFSTSNLPGCAEARRGTSFANAAEVDVVVELLERLETDYRQIDRRKEVGVIAGYSGQVAELVGRLEPSSRKRWQALDIEIATVDAFQGRDRDIIVYSTVRSNREGFIGFLRDRRRINVALSRARELLLLVGDAAMFRRGSTSLDENPFHAVLAYMDSHLEECRIVDWNRAQADTVVA